MPPANNMADISFSESEDDVTAAATQPPASKSQPIAANQLASASAMQSTTTNDDGDDVSLDMTEDTAPRASVPAKPAGNEEIVVDESSTDLVQSSQPPATQSSKSQSTLHPAPAKPTIEASTIDSDDDDDILTETLNSATIQPTAANILKTTGASSKASGHSQHQQPQSATANTQQPVKSPDNKPRHLSTSQSGSRAHSPKQRGKPLSPIQVKATAYDDDDFDITASPKAWKMTATGSPQKSPRTLNEAIAMKEQRLKAEKMQKTLMDLKQRANSASSKSRPSTATQNAERWRRISTTLKPNAEAVVSRLTQTTTPTVKSTYGKLDEDANCNFKPQLSKFTLEHTANLPAFDERLKSYQEKHTTVQKTLQDKLKESHPFKPQIDLGQFGEQLKQQKPLVERVAEELKQREERRANLIKKQQSAECPFQPALNHSASTGSGIDTKALNQQFLQRYEADIQARKSKADAKKQQQEQAAATQHLQRSSSHKVLQPTQQHNQAPFLARMAKDTNTREVKHLLRNQVFGIPSKKVGVFTPEAPVKVSRPSLANVRYGRVKASTLSTSTSVQSLHDSPSTVTISDEPTAASPTSKPLVAVTVADENQPDRHSNTLSPTKPHRNGIVPTSTQPSKVSAPRSTTIRAPRPAPPVQPQLIVAPIEEINEYAEEWDGAAESIHEQEEDVGTGTLATTNLQQDDDLLEFSL